jgi:hypothetical protein
MDGWMDGWGTNAHRYGKGEKRKNIGKQKNRETSDSKQVIFILHKNMPIQPKETPSPTPEAATGKDSHTTHGYTPIHSLLHPP